MIVLIFGKCALSNVELHNICMYKCGLANNINDSFFNILCVRFVLVMDITK